ncbi:MAG: NAD(P)-dependent alcohol dehydrogenase [Planctomycetota bacterium]|nr:MAG: NAD(P)-dependent alcohol dehydrogenase [Planctomycetota bacterium]
MFAFQLTDFGLEHLEPVEIDPPEPGSGEVLVDVRAISPNFRDLLVIDGKYNPKLKLPVIPISDGAGVVAEVGDGVTRWKPGDRVAGHFVTAWIDGPYCGEYVTSTLGTPGPGLAAEQVVLPESALVEIPPMFDFAEAATWPIAALTAWSALVTEGGVEAGQSVLALGTGGVSIFVLQLARALGADMIITSSSDDKLARARELGATHAINYRSEPAWHKRVLALTDGRGVDVVAESGGIATLSQSLAAVRAGGVIAMFGALTGLQGEVNIAGVLMKRVRIAGILVDSRAAFEQMIRFMEQHELRPVISDRFPLRELPAALRHMRAGGHFGKSVVER